MARAVSHPIGPALLSARPFIYLPAAVRRYLRPASLALGNVVAVRGFVELACTDCEGSCFVFSPPAGADPSYFQTGINRFAFDGRFRLPVSGTLDLKFTARVASVGHLTRGTRVFRRLHYGNCPQTCKSDSITGTFAAEVETEFTLGADLPGLWNRRVGIDSLTQLLVLPFGFGPNVARAILDSFIVPPDGRLAFRTTVILGDFGLAPP